MANPQITNVTLSPAMPTGGYVTGTKVRVTATWSDADSTPVVPAKTVTAVLTVTDVAGNVGTLDLPLTWAEKPAYVDIASGTLVIPVTNGTLPVTTISVNGTTGVFEFTAP